MKPETTQQAENAKASRLPYTPPQLVKYGSVTTLTAAGNSGPREDAPRSPPNTRS